MFIIDPPDTAGGTDLLQAQLLTFEARPINRIVAYLDRRCINPQLRSRLLGTVSKFVTK